MKILIVGAGISGATIANKLADKNHVTIIDKRDNIGGNCYDYKKNDILIQRYGAHIFHTNYEDVWNFVKQFATFNTYMHRVDALIDGIQCNIPFNINSLYKVFPETLAKRLETKLLEKYPYNTKITILDFMQENDKDLKFLADYIYEKVFLNYSIKQWGIKPNEVDNEVSGRVPVYISRDDRYFQDKYQGIPIDGYTKMIENILDKPNIKIKLNTNFSDVKEKFDKIIYTGSIDDFFGYKYGYLQYRSVYFKDEEYPSTYFDGGENGENNVLFNYPNNYDFTRIIEHKNFYKVQPEHTIISKEYSEEYVLDKNDRYYPIPNKKNQDLYNKYIDEKPQNVYFLGRLGEYKYYNMDVSIKKALDLSKEIQD
ncbi:MAG: UDP-galactopyranose mutase [Rickettsiales bacterium]|jgi:UDP-galactopyranose mutase|nr:UDP-galactopyranose mutase [Rickettsiales bacterium]